MPTLHHRRRQGADGAGLVASSALLLVVLGGGVFDTPGVRAADGERLAAGVTPGQ